MPQGFRPTVFEVNQIIIPLPSMKIEASMPSVSASIGMPTVSAKIDMGHGTMHVSSPHVDVSMPAVHSTVPGADVRMSVGGMHMNMDMPAPTMEITGAHVEVSGDSHVYVNEPTMHAKIDMPMGDMHVQMKTEGHSTEGDVNVQAKFGF